MQACSSHIAGGPGGLFSAYLLRSLGKAVCVVDKGVIGQAEGNSQAVGAGRWVQRPMGHTQARVYSPPLPSCLRHCLTLLHQRALSCCICDTLLCLLACGCIHVCAGCWTSLGLTPTPTTMSPQRSLAPAACASTRPRRWGGHVQGHALTLLSGYAPVAWPSSLLPLSPLPLPTHTYSQTPTSTNHTLYDTQNHMTDSGVPGGQAERNPPV